MTSHPPSDPLLFTLLNEIGIIEQLARTRFEAAQEDGLKLAHFTLLNHLVRLGDGKSPVALARAFQVTKGAITNTMHRLEERGLISITPDDADGRGKRVWLTDAGRARRTAAVTSLAPAFADLGTVLSEAEIRTLLEPLSRLRKALDAQR